MLENNTINVINNTINVINNTINVIHNFIDVGNYSIDISINKYRLLHQIQIENKIIIRKYF